MSLSFKVSFDFSDFEDDEFLHDLKHIYLFFHNVIVLEYKLYKEKVSQQYSTFQDVFDAIKDNYNQYGNLIFIILM